MRSMLLALHTIAACVVGCSALHYADRLALAPSRISQLRAARARVYALSRLDEAAQVTEWVLAMGGSADAVSVVELPDVGLGLATTREIRRSDVLVSVPLELGISAETALLSSMGTYLTEFEPELADYAFIALAILHERRLGAQSSFSPWLSTETMLPAGGFENLPLIWDDDRLAELDSATVAGACTRRDAIRADFAWLAEHVFEASPVIFPASVFSIEAYTAAVALAISRSVAVEDTDGVAVPILMCARLARLPPDASAAMLPVRARATCVRPLTARACRSHAARSQPTPRFAQPRRCWAGSIRAAARGQEQSLWRARGRQYVCCLRSAGSDVGSRRRRASVRRVRRRHGRPACS